MSAIVVSPPQVSPVPLVVTVPHAGRTLSADLEAALRVPPQRLRQLEDPWVDRLLDAATAAGGWLVATGWARAVADVNRAADEFAFSAPMPGWRATAKALPAVDVVLGDRWGTAAEAAWIAAVERALATEGLVTARNRPYAGGFITRHYGRPADGVHVVQLELRRGLYMDETAFLPRPSFDEVRARFARVLAHLAAYLRARGQPAFALAGE